MSSGPPFLFDDCTAVRPGPGDGEWNVDLSEQLTIMKDRPNGGYLLAVMGRAAVAALGEEDRHVVGATVSYISPPSTGPATVVTEVRRRGRTASQLRVALVQDEEPKVESLMTLAGLAGGSPDWGDVAPPDMPDEDTCRAAGRDLPSPVTGGAPPMAAVVEQSFDPATLGWARGAPSGEGEIRAWLRFADGRPFDPLGLLFAFDAVPPATFEVAFTGWVPTLSLTAYIRARPAPGPLRLRFRVGTIAAGFADETCEVWDSEDHLVAQSTQLAAIRFP
ncbi:thioesterase family protein [soil metagenome]